MKNFTQTESVAAIVIVLVLAIAVIFLMFLFTKTKVEYREICLPPGITYFQETKNFSLQLKIGFDGGIFKCEDIYAP